MTEIFVTSDWHFGHDREFIWSSRGFSSIEEHDEELIKRFNDIVEPDDLTFVLGDLMLGDEDHGLECINRLNGKLSIILGNHDTERRKQLYKERLKNVVDIQYATMFKLPNGYRFYCSHYPTLTSNLEPESLKQAVIDLFGHTHQKEDFYKDIPTMFHVGVDSHSFYPVNIYDALELVKLEVGKCQDYLRGFRK